MKGVDNGRRDDHGGRGSLVGRGRQTNGLHDDALSEEHRRRRRVAHERAAAAHDEAAVKHDQTAAFMDEHGYPDRAAEHRLAAEDNRRAAEADRLVAGRYREQPCGTRPGDG